MECKNSGFDKIYQKYIHKKYFGVYQIQIPAILINKSNSFSSSTSLKVFPVKSLKRCLFNHFGYSKIRSILRGRI